MSEYWQHQRDSFSVWIIDLAAECARRVEKVTQENQSLQSQLQRERTKVSALKAHLRKAHNEDEFVAYEAYGYGGVPKRQVFRLEMSPEEYSEFKEWKAGNQS